LALTEWPHFIIAPISTATSLPIATQSISASLSSGRFC
jgi:hypothetical protein